MEVTHTNPVHQLCRASQYNLGCPDVHMAAWTSLSDCTHDCLVDFVDFAGAIVEAEGPLCVQVIRGEGLQVKALMR